jgi:hypothetical protein
MPNTNIASAPVAAARHAAQVLAFDPSGRRSSRRLIAAALAHEQLEAAQQNEASAMGLTGQDCAQPDLYAHAHLIRDVEAAYAKNPAEGRAALLSVLVSQYGDGYETGCEDAAPVRVRR